METMPFEQAVLIFAQLHRGRCFERLTELRNACLHTDSYDLQDFTESLVENDGGPGSGNFGHSGRPGKIGGSAQEGVSAQQEAKASRYEISKSLQPEGTNYSFDLSDGEDDFVRKNVKALKPIFQARGSKGIQEEFFKLRMQNSTKDVHRISEDEADDILYENLSRGILQQWFREYNHEVKPGLVYQLTRNPKVRNAALNVMYENYKFQCEYIDKKKPLGFEDFLVTPIKMYRGGSGKERKDPNVFSSYTFSRKVAESFTGSNEGQGAAYDPNGVVWEAEIRPIDTYGSVYTNGEAEIMVPGTIAPNGNRDEENVKQADGGPGSGNFGHEGRPGQVGGSAPTDTASAEEPTKLEKFTMASRQLLKNVKPKSYKFNKNDRVRAAILTGIDDGKSFIYENVRRLVNGGYWSDAIPHGPEVFGMNMIHGVYKQNVLDAIRSSFLIDDKKVGQITTPRKPGDTIADNVTSRMDLKRMASMINDYSLSTRNLYNIGKTRTARAIVETMRDTGLGSGDATATYTALSAFLEGEDGRYSAYKMSRKFPNLQTPRLLEQYIRLTPKYQGEAYRGLTVEDPDEAERYLSKFRDGDTFDQNGLTTWTASEEIARGHANGTGIATNFIFKLSNPKAGAYVGHLSKHDEQEVLVSGFSQFRAKSVKQIDPFNYEVELDEVS